MNESSKIKTGSKPTVCDLTSSFSVLATKVEMFPPLFAAYNKPAGAVRSRDVMPRHRLIVKTDFIDYLNLFPNYTTAAAADTSARLSRVCGLKDKFLHNFSRLS